MKQEVLELLHQAVATLKQHAVLAADVQPRFTVERSRDPEHGDLASNAALTMAKAARLNPREMAQKLCAVLPESDLIERTEIAGPGFINFYLSKCSSQAVVTEILAAGRTYGHNTTGAGRKAQVEFVSANPTGPLHVGHGRGAAVGDSLVRLLKANGWEAAAEFYYNDAGQQIENLARSIAARCKGLGPEDPDWPSDGYRGEYIQDVARAYLRGDRVDAEDKQVVALGDAEDTAAIRDFAVAYLRREQDQDLRAFGVDFDRYFLESSLYQSGEVERTVKALVEAGHCYEKDAALWLRTTDFGDDKDRVMRKTDGTYTYFLPDVAYHYNKWRRGFGLAINEQGADHHSTVTRVRAGLQALNVGIPPGWPDYVLHQMVTVIKGGAEVKISKRAGSYLTLRDLIDEVGRDATRYFLVARAANSQLTFDIDLAISQSNDNPVYYIQYAHARACSIQRKLAEQGWNWDAATGLKSLHRLDQELERGLLNRLAAFPDMVRRATEQREPHQVATFLRELAADYHSYYNRHKMLVDDVELRNARVALSLAVRQVLANGLDLLGVSAPEAM